ncbi:tetraspanin-7-like isoform X2 [Ascaphus truei]|uniref:tetraspanin-7-like isoform X2 n=1 Tax=Ascaphus truei TaxID=8439 RepID=UPI003F5A8DBD
MTDRLADQVLPRLNAAVKNEGLELEGGRRRSSLAGFPLTSHHTGVWVLPAYPQEDGEGQQPMSHQTITGSILQKDEILVGPLISPKSPLQRSRTCKGSRMALLKLSLMAFSFIFWLAGLAMLTVGIWTKISMDDYLVLSTNDYPNTPLILLATGAAVLLWGFLGCFSAVAEKRCLVRTYGLFQLAVLMAGLAAGLFGLFYRRDIAEGFQSGLQDAVLSYSEDEEKANALDAIQRALRCCGVHSYRDWLESPWSMEQQEQCQSPPQTSNGSVPTSCCQVRSGCRNSPLLPGAPGIHWDGCFKKVCDFVSDNMFYIATAALGLAVTQVVGIILSCLFASRIPHRVPDMIPT